MILITQNWSTPGNVVAQQLALLGGRGWAQLAGCAGPARHLRESRTQKISQYGAFGALLSRGCTERHDRTAGGELRG